MYIEHIEGKGSRDWTHLIDDSFFLVMTGVFCFFLFWTYYTEMTQYIGPYDLDLQLNTGSTKLLML